MKDLPVVVVGAGPIGLAAATHLAQRNIPTHVIERGSHAGASVVEWNHVRLFSRWAEVIDPAGRALLTNTEWTPPDDDTYPTGREWVTQYLRPLSEALRSSVEFSYDTEVVGIARRGRDRLVDSGRDTEPFSVYLHTADRQTHKIAARAIIDATGTWQSPNLVGSEGLPAIGEDSAHTRISYRIPDLDSPTVRDELAGKHIAVVGSGHSALTAVGLFAAFAQSHPGTTITWARRRGTAENVFGGGSQDELPQRGALGVRAKKAVEDGLVSTITGFRTEQIETHDDNLELISDTGARIVDVDHVVALTGFRPNNSWLTELRLNLDYTLEAPVALAPLIDPNVHSCGTVYPHGYAELSHPEPNFFIVGMKSYGRAPTFLAMTGFEQVRSIAAALAGDFDSAAQVELTLPDTGVCGGAGVFDDPNAEGSGGCCAPPQSSATVAPAQVIALESLAMPRFGPRN
ncbi:FAD-dependent oxidoreductase [Hoyosella rhizosphaerae]|uniref:Secreted protein n=1 Tax=Hoyosella rhizosphaerae TaxID=1755582 RepID=A0A916UF94_9ACTN|nr:FAD-dependent oxidoreductase [Hoyosella rhizosphaerae]MBN4927994.1 FAD-dependent oxidoreductase [Hoyosella rhizosphaerae]GGC71541.1 putative secreted protein [Hoyosella rhizosphaerae]